MKLALVLNGPFIEYGGHYYSQDWPSTVLEMRYLKWFDELVVVSRERKSADDPSGKLVQSDSDRIEFRCMKEKSRISRILGRKSESDFFMNAIADCDAVISRGWNGAKAARKQNKKYMMEVVGCVWDAYWNHSLLGKAVAIPNFLIQKREIRISPYVLYVSKEFLQNRYPTNGISAGISDVALPEEADVGILDKRIYRIHESNRKWILGTAAAINVAYKGQRFVVDALSILKKKGVNNFEYWLAGSGSSEVIEAYAKEKGVSENIKVIGSVPHDKMFDWYDAVDIYIQPSLQEGLCRSLVEAMSRGIPCIATDVGGNPELVDAEYLVSYKDKMNISNGIVKALERLVNPEEYEVVSRSNFKKANENYNKEYLDSRREAFYTEFREYCNK